MITKTKTFVVVRTRVFGVHCWTVGKKPPAAVGYLRHPHHHWFYVRAVMPVAGSRDVEIIMLAEEIRRVLSMAAHKNAAKKALQQGWMTGTLDFGDMSCEQMAQHLVDCMGLDECEVTEDGVNGAIVRKE